jgi:pilus assembly protein Flp/PilA
MSRRSMPITVSLSSDAGFIARKGTNQGSQRGIDMKLIDMFKAFVRDEEGATAVEYGLIAALITVVISANVQQIGIDLNTAFGAIATALPTAAG